MEASGGTVVDRGRKKRRRYRRRRPGGQGGRPPSPGRSDGDRNDSESARPVSPGGQAMVEAQVPQHVIARSAGLEGSEDNLRHALIATVVGECSGLSVELLTEQIARRFGLAEEMLVVRRDSPASYLVILPDEASAVRVYNGGQPFISPSLRLHFRRWSRFYCSNGLVCASEVDVTISGIPAHA